MREVNIQVENEVTQVTVTISPEELAKVYALRAEAAQAGAEEAEEGAEASATASANSATAALGSQNAAAASASTAATEAGEAAASASAAASSAASAATQVGLAAIEADRAKDEADRAESEANRAKDEADRAESEADEAASSAAAASGFANTASEKAGEAAASASAALSSQNAAASSANTATAQAGIATTKANEAAASAAAALVSQNAAASSAATITNQVDFTGAQAFDFLQRDGVNFKPVRENVPFQRVQPFLRSPFAGLFDLDRIVAWDSFSRANSSSVGNFDSGQTWQTVLGSGWSISNNTLSNSSANASILVGNFTSSSSLIQYGYTITTSCRAPSQNPTAGAICIYKDASNYIRIYPTRDRAVVIQTVGGVDTTILTHSWSFPISTGTGFTGVAQNIQIELIYRVAFFNESFLTIKQLDLNQQVNLNITTLINNTFPTISDVSQVGLFHTAAGGSSFGRFSIIGRQ